MSLDIYLEDPSSKYDTKELYWGNITHNLAEMAREATIYNALWRPDEIGAKKANDIFSVVKEGLVILKRNPDYFKTFNSPNGWGTYNQCVSFVEYYLEALEMYPEAIIRVSR